MPALRMFPEMIALLHSVLNGLFHPLWKSVNYVPGGCSQVIKSQGFKKLK